MREGKNLGAETKRFRGRDFLHHGLKVRYGGVILNIPLVEEDIIIPAFNIFQHLSVLKLVERVGKDFDLCYELASHIFEKVVDWSADNPGVIPTNQVYRSWLAEFQTQKGFNFRSHGAA